MAILEKIAVSADKIAETSRAILITNRQQKTARFRGRKPALLRVPAGFGGEWCGNGARKIPYVKYHMFGAFFPQLHQ